MLRHIISVSLAMTACAALIPTKANAATLTVTPIGTLLKNPGESITFIVSLNPAPFEGFDSFTFKGLFYDYDGNELSFDPTKSNVALENTIVNNTQDIARLTFTVLQGVKKDGQSDLFGAYAIYKERDAEDEPLENTPDAAGVFDVQPVPEPLTMLGAAAALGYGAILKRKYSKNTES